MLRVIYNLTTKEVASVLWPQGETLYNQQMFGLLQGDINSIFAQTTALGINPQPIVDFLTNEGMDVSLLINKSRVAYKRSKGGEIYERYLAENEQISIPTEQNIILVSMLQQIKTLLESGAITSVRDILLGMDQATIESAFFPVEPYLTAQERYQTYIDELNGILTFLNS